MLYTKKSYLKIISFVIIFTLVLPIVFPYGPAVYAFRNPTGKEIPAPDFKKQPEMKKELPKRGKSKVELTERRGKNHREYLNPDGSFTKEIYTNQIHWKTKQGVWKEIDNTLVESGDSLFPYKNAANSLGIWFAKETENQAIAKVEEGDYRIELIPQNSNKSKGVPLESKIVYADIYPHVDIEYTAQSMSVKEDIVIKDVLAQNRFEFKLAMKGLEPVDQQNGNIAFVDKNQKIVFLMGKPYAYDGNDVLTENATMQLRQSGEEWFVDVELDREWLDDPSRVFPVVLDPTIDRVGSIQDTFVASGSPDSNFSTRTWLAMGRNTSGINYSYLWFELPAINSGAQIKWASLQGIQYVVDSSSTTIDLHQVTKPWDATKLTWNNKDSVTFDKTPITSTSEPATGEKVWTLDATNVIKGWYEGSIPNYGFLLKARTDTMERRAFYSSEANSPPKLIVNYTVNPIGVEEFWSYVGNVNVNNGNLILSERDVYLPGRGIPIQITRSYNSVDTFNGMFGYGWRLNTGMFLTFNDPLNSKIIVLTDGDGTKHTFIQDEEGTWQSPPGVHLEIRYQAATSSIPTAYFILTDKSQTNFYFNASNGRLEFYKDENNNRTNIYYNTDGTIRSLLDPSGRSVRFNYENGRIRTISGAEIPTVSYEFNVAGQLESITHLDSAGNQLKKIIYGYDANQNINSITDSKGYVTTIRHSTEDRVREISKRVTVNGVVQTYRTLLSYTSGMDGMITDVTDPKGIITRYISNDTGNVTSIFEAHGSNDQRETTFTWDQENNMTSITDPRRKKTVLSYDDKGNLEQIHDAKNNSNIMKYDDQNNLVQSTGFSGEKSNSHYDQTNMIADVNSLGGTSIYEHDSHGNVLRSTEAISLADNIVLNSGFESWSTTTSPQHWTGSGSISRGGFHVNGNSSVRLDSTSSSSLAILTSDYLPVEGDVKYNVSWFIRRNAVTGNANVKIEWYRDRTTSSRLLTTGALDNARGTAEWTRQGARTISPTNANFARIVITMDRGTAWFDNIQLEKGTHLNNSNLLANHSFESGSNPNGYPLMWEQLSTLQEGTDGVDTTTGKNSKRSITLRGVSSANKFIGQANKVFGDAGDQISVSGWSKATGVNATGGLYRLMLRVGHSDGTVSYHGFDFRKTSHDWEYVEGIVKINKSYINLTLYAQYENQTGQAWFDDIKINLSTVPNSIMSEYNLAQNGSFEYDLDSNSKADQWQEFIQSSTRATMNWIKNEEDAYIGGSAVSISNSGGWATYGNTQNEPIRVGKTYTASAMVKADGVTTGAGIVKIDLYDTNGQYLGQKVSDKKISGTKGWTRVFVSLSETEAKRIHPNAVSMKVTVGTLERLTGTIYFDAVRWESRAITSNFTYDSKGNFVTSESDALGFVTNYENDARGNVKRIDFPNTGSFTTYKYDELDRITYVEDSTIAIDLKKDANGNVNQIDYIDRTKNLLWSSVSQKFNERDQITELTDQNGKVTSFAYDPNGNVERILYPNQKGIIYQYNAYDEIKTTSYIGDSRTWSFEYDKNGNILQVLKNNTEITNYEMDPDLNQVAKETYPTVNGVRNTLQYEYDPSGRVTAISHSLLGAKPISFKYDPSGKATDMTGVNGQSAAHMYDETGLLKKIFVNDGSRAYVTYNEYNEIGMLASMRQETIDGNMLYFDTFIYDPNGNLTDIRYMDGSRVSYSYDTSNQLRTERQFNSSGVLVSSIAYEYDFLGNRKQMTRNNVTTIYDYDKANQLKSIGTRVISHDDQGNLTSDGIHTYQYNADHELTLVRNTNGATIGAYEYNHEGKRTKKVAGGKTETYYYHSSDLSYITDGNNKLRYHFTRNAMGQLLTLTDHTGASPVNYFYVLNHRGDVLGLRDRNGNMVVSYTYDAFGNILSSTGTATTGDGRLLRTENPFRYASYVYDEETKFYYLNQFHNDKNTPHHDYM